MAKKSSKRWMQSAVKRPGALRRKLHKKKGEKISMAELNSRIARLKKKKKLTPEERRTLRQLVLARTFKRVRRARK